MDEICKICGYQLQQGACPICEPQAAIPLDEVVALHQATQLVRDLIGSGKLLVSNSHAIHSIAAQLAPVLSEMDAAELSNFLLEQVEVSELYASDSELQEVLHQVSGQPLTVPDPLQGAFGKKFRFRLVPQASLPASIPRQELACEDWDSSFGKRHPTARAKNADQFTQWLKRRLTSVGGKLPAGSFRIGTLCLEVAVHGAEGKYIGHFQVLASEDGASLVGAIAKGEKVTPLSVVKDFEAALVEK